MKPAGIRIEYHFPTALITGVYFGCLAPIDWNEDWNPWARCNPNKTNEITYKTTLQISANLACRSPQKRDSSTGNPSMYL